MTPEEREELLVAYALGTLRGPEAAEVEELVRTDRGAARDLAAYHEMVDFLALSVPLRRADPSLRDRVLNAAPRQPCTCDDALVALAMGRGCRRCCRDACHRDVGLGPAARIAPAGRCQRRARGRRRG